MSLFDMDLDKNLAEEQVNSFINRCKKLGIKVTPQRIAIYKELANTKEHSSTEEIFKKIRSYYPNISLTTIYRTLETFGELGLISVVNILNNAARYDANLEPHHHIVCVVCKKVEDFYDNSLSNLNIPESALLDYKLLGYTVQINGICTDCNKKKT